MQTRTRAHMYKLTHARARAHAYAHTHAHTRSTLINGITRHNFKGVTTRRHNFEVGEKMGFCKKLSTVVMS